MFDRLSSLFKKKKSRSRQQSNDCSDAGTPTPPLSPCSPLSQYEAGRNGYGEDGNRSPWPGSSGAASLLRDEADLPFADSDSSGRSSVREVMVCRVRAASDEDKSGNVTPTTEPVADPGSGLGFTHSVVEEVSKRLQIHLEEDGRKDAEGEDRAVTPTTPMTFKTLISKTAEAPKSPNLTSISLATKKTCVRIGEKGHSTSLTGIRLGSQSSTSHLITTQEEGGGCGDGEKDNSRAQVLSGETISTKSETEGTPRGDSPVLLHKAIYVETHLGEEEEEEGRGAAKKEEEEEGCRVDSPPLLAVPATVIQEDECVAEGRALGPPASSESGCLAHTAGEFQAGSAQPQEPAAGTASKQSSLQERRRPRENRVTRKTVNLPSKHKVFAQKVRVSPEPGSEEAEEEEEESSADSASKISDAAPVEL